MECKLLQIYQRATDKMMQKEKLMGEKEKRLRKAIDELHSYAENPKNPLDSPAFSELLDELYLARDAMIAAELPDPDVGL